MVDVLFMKDLEPMVQAKNAPNVIHIGFGCYDGKMVKKLVADGVEYFGDDADQWLEDQGMVVNA